MGQYVNLGAKGPGPDLYYMESGAWTTDQAEALVFLGVFDAHETGIIGLPPGYNPVLIQVFVPRIPQEEPPPPCTPPFY